MKPFQFTPAASFLLAEISREFFPDNLVQVVMVSGQRCTAISRVLVHKDLAAETTEILTASANAIRLGPGLEADNDLGPLCNLPHWAEARATTERAISGGAKPLAGGFAPNRPDDGYCCRPTILGDVLHESIASQEEIFGPVLSVLEYDIFDQAMEMLNGTEFGQTSVLFSNRNDLIQRFLAESRNGMIHVNRGTAPGSNMPFVGIKNSGVGACSAGPTAVNFCTSGHSACVAS